MKILLVVPMIPRPDGAGAIPMLLHAQLQGLTSRHEVTLVSTVGDDPGEADAAADLLRSGLDAHFVDRRIAPARSVRMQRRLRLATTWATRPWPWRTVWFARPQVQAIVDRLAAERDFDVVAVEDSAMSVFDLPAGVPTVFTEHEAYRASPPGWSAEKPSELPRKIVESVDWSRWEEFQQRSWQRFDLIQVFSPGDAETIASLAPDLRERVRVNPFGIDPPPAVDPGAEEEDLVLFVGNFTHPPNRDAALWLATEILPRLTALRPTARLRLVGHAPPREVQELAGGQVEVVADAPAVEPHLAAASVVLAPVRSGGGMRMKVLEALARGKSIVTTPRGTEGYLCFEQEPPFLVGESAEEIAAEAAALLDDPARRREMAQRARTFALAFYSPGPWGERLERVYSEAVSGAEGPASGGANGGEPSTAREPF
jgi:glycosyltransferase involved in cell wall biosynthesis